MNINDSWPSLFRLLERRLWYLSWFLLTGGIHMYQEGFSPIVALQIIFLLRKKRHENYNGVIFTN